MVNSSRASLETESAVAGRAVVAMDAIFGATFAGGGSSRRSAIEVNWNRLRYFVSRSDMVLRLR